MLEQLFWVEVGALVTGELTGLQVRRNRLEFSSAISNELKEVLLVYNNIIMELHAHLEVNCTCSYMFRTCLGNEASISSDFRPERDDCLVS